MTQFIEPNKKSDLVAPRVFDWLKSLRTGLLDGFTVTPGSSGLLITIASGRVIIGGTTIYDDLTRNDATLISSAPGTGNRHFLVYAKYTYVDSFPPAAMEIKVTVNSAVAPLKPTAPALPPDSVKLADIFLPEGETDWTNALFVNAPRVPDRGQADGDVLVERLIASNVNVTCAGGGSLIYTPGPTNELSWSQDIKFFALTTTHQEKYFSPPLAAGQILAGASPLTGVTDNCIVFTILDRTTVGDPAAPGTLSLYVLDLTAPDAGVWDIFFDPANRDDIFWLAMVIDGDLVTRAGVGNALPSPDADGEKFLRNDPGGDHYWSLLNGGVVKSDYVKGGLHEYEWSSGTYDTVYLALDALITSERRNKGMVVRMLRTGDTTWGTYTWDGSAWQPIADVAATYGHGVINGFTVAIVGGGASVSIGQGILVDWNGNVFVHALAETGFVPTGPGTWIIYYNPSTKSFGIGNHEVSGVSYLHVPLAIGVHNGTIWTGLQQCQKYANGVKSDHFVTVGATTGLDAANFTTVRKALMWMSCFPQPWGKSPREIRVISDIDEVAQDHIFGCISFDNDGGSAQYDPYLTSTLCDAFTGLRIVGYTDGTDQTHPHPVITFTQLGYYGYFINFNFTKHVHIEGLSFKYTGLQDHFDTYVCVFLNLGPGAHVVDCEMIETTAPLTTFATWYKDGNFNFGGFDEDAELDGTTFERVRIDSATPDDVFNFYATGTITGRLNLINCSFSGASANYQSLVDGFDDVMLGNKTVIVVDNCFIANCEDRIFYLGLYTNALISNCVFGTRALDCVDVHWNAPGVQVCNCTYLYGARMTLGARMYTGCQFMTKLTIGDDETIFTGCMNEEYPFGHASGMAIASRFDGTQRSQVLMGCELGPYATIDVTQAYGAGRVSPGVALFPNGRVGRVVTQTYPIWNPGLGQMETIGGSTAWTEPPGDGTEYPFYFFLRCDYNDATPVLRFDVLPPDVYGRPQAVGGTDAAAGYTVDDYCYVGTIEFHKARIGCDGTIEHGVSELCQQGAYVQYLGTGVRKFGLASTWSVVSKTHVSGNYEDLEGGHYDALDLYKSADWVAKFRNAVAFGWTLKMTIYHSGGTGNVNVSVTCGGVAFTEVLAPSASVDREFNVETPLIGLGTNPSDVRVRIQNFGAATNFANIDYEFVIHTIVEDVNRIGVREVQVKPI